MQCNLKRKFSVRFHWGIRFHWVWASSTFPFLNRGMIIPSDHTLGNTPLSSIPLHNANIWGIDNLRNNLYIWLCPQMISTLVLIGAACMYTEAYPRREYPAHAHMPLLRSTGRLQLPRSPGRSHEGQHVISRRTIVSLLSPSGAVRDAVARVFARRLKVQPASWQPWCG
jgi:hypothetical protein